MKNRAYPNPKNFFPKKLGYPARRINKGLQTKDQCRIENLAKHRTKIFFVVKCRYDHKNTKGIPPTPYQGGHAKKQKVCENGRWAKGNTLMCS